MPLEFGLNVPWQDNWPVRRQLWAFADSRDPGDELDLSNPTGRNLTAQWRDADGGVVYAIAEPAPGLKVEHAKRGVVLVTPSGDIWDYLKQRETYTLEIIAYGVLYSSSEYRIKPPEQGHELINGVEYYGAPRQILELLGPIPGAVTQTGIVLSGDWELNDQGYWVRDIPATHPVYGLWVNDRHTKYVDYADLALSGTRAYTRVATSSDLHTLYYKGPENLAIEYIETAHNRYVLRCLQEATAEVERKTATFFNLRRVYRETHRGLWRQRQLVTRHRPIQVDYGFRLDNFSFTRNLYRRYTEEDFEPGGALGGSSTLLHAENETGVITINSNIWDWVDGIGMVGDYGMAAFSRLTKGENNVEVSYLAGYETTPKDVDEAATNVAACRMAIFWHSALSQGLSGISIGCVNMNFGELFAKWMPGWQQSADQILGGYQHTEIEAF